MEGIWGDLTLHRKCPDEHGGGHLRGIPEDALDLVAAAPAEAVGLLETLSFGLLLKAGT